MSFSIPDKAMAWLLFDDRMPIDLQAFAERFLAEQLVEGVHFHIRELSPEHDVLCMDGSHGLRVRVEQLAEPLPVRPLHRILESPYLKIVSPRAGVSVDGHRSAVAIEVSFAETAESRAGQPVPTVPVSGMDGYITCLETLKQLTCGYVEFREPSLIHWVQSNLLLDRQTFVTSSREEMPSLLNIHPQLYSNKTDAKGQWVGLSTYGAAQFLGREIKFKSAPVPWGNLYEYALDFLRFAVSDDGYVVPDGDTFGDDRGLSIAVRHVSNDIDCGQDVYELTLLQAPDLGYECDTEDLQAIAQDGDDVHRHLDPDDAIDRAILERLAARGGPVAETLDDTPVDMPETAPPSAPVVRGIGGFGRRQASPST